MNMPNYEELYDRFVKGLETKHRGAFAAVRPDGQVIVDKDDVKVVDRALKQFGPANFMLLNVGSKGSGEMALLDSTVISLSPPHSSVLELKFAK